MLTCAAGSVYPITILTALLTEEVEATAEKPAFNHIRTDLGLYLDNRDTATHLALPATYRRVDTPSHYYAKTN
jgi:hypothetical protein